MIILGMDTSSVNATVALLNDRKLIGEYIISNDRTHSQIIMPLLDDLLSKTGINISDVDVFATCIGPGSFTGLRIGITTIKTLAQAMNKPVIGIDSLKGLSLNVMSNDYICPLIDARHNQVYTALYKDNLCKTEPDVVDIDILLESLRGKKTVFVGDGVLTYQDKINEFANENWKIAPINLQMQKASSICYGAYERAVNNDFDNLFSLVPLYLRKSQAERELEEKNK